MELKRNEDPDILRIGGTEFARGSSGKVELEIARLPTHTRVDMPVYIFRGKKPGPSLLLTAAIHGDETNGTETLRRMIRKGMLKPKRGTIIAVPIVNVYGFLLHIRTMPDGKDLNRSFPGGKTGSLARRIAYVLMNEVLPHVDCGVDFHTGGAQIMNYPQVRCVFDVPANMELARLFGPPLIINSKLIDKSFRKSAWLKKVPIIVYEGGQSFRFDEFSIEEGIRGVERIMSGLGMIDAEAPPAETHVLISSSWMRARISGIARARVKVGQRVAKGEVLFEIGDPFGETQKTMKAAKPSIVVGINDRPVVSAGDALVHLGQIEE